MSKLTEEQKNILKKYIQDKDNELVHCEMDKLMRNRLIELDKEFVSEIDSLINGMEMWYA